MRVTQSMLSSNTLRQLSSSYQKMQTLTDQLTTGKKITRPSQDPVTAMKGVRYRTEVSENNQFLERNLAETYNWVETSDSTLDKVNLAVQRIRELTVQASNDTYDQQQREAVATEIDQLIDHIGDLANTKVNNKYIFNGTDTTNPPINQELLNSVAVGPTGAVTFPDGALPTNNEKVIIEVMKGVKLDVNVSPGDVFTSDLFADLKQLSATLKNGETSSDFLGKIDGHVNTINTSRANLGAKLNRVEMVENRLSEQEVIAKRIMSQNEDVDIEKVIIDLTSQEALHRAALSVGGRIIQPTLVDFLR